jgi:uncharacterized peroxidase-related enzyme
MSRIAAIDPEKTQGKTHELLTAVHQMLGATPNMFRVAAQAPAVLEALVGFNVAAAHGVLRPAVRQSIALTVAEANGCDYCLSAHSFIGTRIGLSEEDQARARTGSARDPKTDALLRFARALVLERGNLGEPAVAGLRAAGVSDAELLETIAHVALNVFTNYLNKVVGTDIDFPVVRHGQGR